MINEDNVLETLSNMTRIICSFLASESEHSWIINTGAMNHMVSTHKMLFDLSDYTKKGIGTMHLPDSKQLPFIMLVDVAWHKGILVMYRVFLTSSLIH